MAIGDGENDIEMLELASLGIALSNGSEKTKAVANVIGPSNDEDGVADAIYRYAFWGSSTEQLEWTCIAWYPCHEMQSAVVIVCLSLFFFERNDSLWAWQIRKKKKKGEREALPFPLLSENCDSVLILQILSIIYTHSYSMWPYFNNLEKEKQGN